MADNGVCAAELRNITKIYPGSRKKANDGISLDLKRGEILCVAGGNGAGKTTLMKILCGIETPTSGEICLYGKQTRIDSPLVAKKLGIGMVHQHFMLFPEYTVAENIVIGNEPRKWGLFLDRAKIRSAALAVMAAQGFSIEPDRPAHTLSTGEMQQAEICRILYRGADIIILDEPTAVLAEEEAAALFRTLKVLASAGKSLILITHKLKEITAVSSRIAVLCGGRLIGMRETAGADEYEISRMMTGGMTVERPLRRSPPPAAAPSAKEAVIAFENVTVLRKGQKRRLLDGLSFGIGSGEIVGFAGFGGNGLGVLEAVLSGFLHPASGRVLHRGKDISRLSIRALRGAGLAYVPADRLRVGCSLDATVRENMAINRRREYSRFGFLDRKAIARFADSLVTRYNIAGASLRGRASPQAVSLSGGNLQKLILAREIEQWKDYMVFSEPAWGLDFASTAFVRSRIAELRGRGAAIALISTDLDELLELADRILVLYRGRAAGEFAIGEAVDAAPLKTAISACMQGLAHNGAE